MKFTGNSFDDGSILSYILTGSEVSIMKDDELLDFSDVYRQAVAFQNNSSIIVEFGRFIKQLDFAGPVTIGTVLDSLIKLANTPPTEIQYKHLEDNNELSKWNKSWVPTWEIFKQKINTLGKLNGDHVFFEGFYSISPDVYGIHLGS